MTQTAQTVITEKPSKPNYVVRGINWNRVKDPKDLEVWNRLINNFWIPERIPLSNDRKCWSLMTPTEQRITLRVFTGLTVLDTTQNLVGAPAIMADARCDFEAAVMSNIIFMEAVHAKSYSSVFSTLCSTEQIDETFLWAEKNQYIQEKGRLIVEEYQAQDNEYKRKIASVLLESFLFYSGFYWPLRLSSQGKLTNTADLIRLIIRDEAVHGFYIGYKYQLSIKDLSDEEREELRVFAYSLLYALYEQEELYAAEIYDEIGLTAEVHSFMRYNANKALANMGYDPMFPSEVCDVPPSIMTALDPSGNENHDFFSGAGSSYTLATFEPMEEADWQ